MTYELTKDRSSLALHCALVPHLLADPERVFGLANEKLLRSLMRIVIREAQSGGDLA